MVGYEANYDPLISSNPTRYHLHFFWDIYDPSTVGSNEPFATRGDWVIWDKKANGELIFDDWVTTDVPFGATAICVVPATSTHAVANVDRVVEAFDCIALPTP